MSNPPAKKIIKKISIDTNHNYIGGAFPLIDSIVIEIYDLMPNEHVLAIQDDDVWESIVKFDPNLPEEYQWYIELGKDISPTLSEEMVEGRSQGTWEGFLSGRTHGIRLERYRIVEELLKAGIEINEISKYTNLSQHFIETHFTKNKENGESLGYH